MDDIRLSTIIFCLSLHYAYQYEIADVEISETENDFDILILAQKWPVTVCKYWLNDLNGSECEYPNDKNRWTLHGIWPSKFDAQYNYCNTSWAFDPEQIKSIEGVLEQRWTQVYKENDRYKSWEHEWLKHGTCATSLEPLDSEFKYFSKGIEWNQKYSISDMLAAAKIFPSDTEELNPEQFINAVKTRTNKSAMMRCYFLDGVMYVKELRICFDKQFNLIDCKQPAISEHCQSSKTVVFPANA